MLTAAAAVFGGLTLGSGVSRPRPTAVQKHRPAASHSVRPHAPGLIPASVGTIVLMWPEGCTPCPCCGGGASYVDNLRTGKLIQSQVPDIGVGDYQPLLVPVGDYLVYVGHGASAIRDDLKGRPRVLGKTPFFAPSAMPGHVWLIYPRLYPRRHGRDIVRSEAVPSSSASIFVRTAWSVDGSWLFYQGPGQHMWAYQVSTKQVRSSGPPCCRYTVMVGVPS